MPRKGIAWLRCDDLVHVFVLSRHNTVIELYPRPASAVCVGQHRTVPSEKIPAVIGTLEREADRLQEHGSRFWSIKTSISTGWMPAVGLLLNHI